MPRYLGDVFNERWWEMAGVYSRAWGGRRRVNRQEEEEAWACRRGQVMSRGVNDRGAITLRCVPPWLPRAPLYMLHFILRPLRELPANRIPSFVPCCPGGAACRGCRGRGRGVTEEASVGGNV